MYVLYCVTGQRSDTEFAIAGVYSTIAQAVGVALNAMREYEATTRAQHIVTMQQWNHYGPKQHPIYTPRLYYTKHSWQMVRCLLGESASDEVTHVCTIDSDGTKTVEGAK